MVGQRSTVKVLDAWVVEAAEEQAPSDGNLVA
jgi:hypothetical protein